MSDLLHVDNAQTLAGDTQAAARTAFQYYMTVWRRFGAVPEMFDLGANTVRSSHPQYPLRPGQYSQQF